MQNIKIVAGNWKMNKTKIDISNFVSQIQKLDTPSCHVFIAAPFLYLDYLKQNSPSWLHIAAQNVSSEEKGAYTGEISAEMLNSIDVKYAVVGHSERRQYFSESPSDLAKKIKQCVNRDIKPILRIGENLEERETKQTLNVIENQLTQTLLEFENISNFILAYEPIWAIGTGKNASSQEAEDVHSFIDQWIKQNYGAQTSIPILYGGSCSPKNAKELFSMPNISGGLIGGASLEADSFAELIQIGNTFS